MSETATSSHKAKKTSPRAVDAVNGIHQEPIETIECEFCGKISPKTKKNKKYCDDICKKAYWKMQHEIAKTLAKHNQRIESLEQRVKELEGR